MTTTSELNSATPLDYACGRLRALEEDIREVRAQPDVTSLLRVLGLTGDVHQAAADLEHSLVGVLRRAETSWVEIAGALGLSRQTAWERHRSAEASMGPQEEALLSLLAASTTDEPPVLQPGEVYTRAQLRRMFSVVDATIKNGIFINKELGQIWLFITENKTPDRTPYEDLLEGDTLRMQGQTMGRTDQRIINHVSEGFPLMVFYRKSKREHPGAGFRFEGEFIYVDHQDGGPPTNFTLKRVT